jgi:hypothetical protein
MNVAVGRNAEIASGFVLRRARGVMVSPGSILCTNVGSGVSVSVLARETEDSVDMNSRRYSKQKVMQNIDYIAQLFALYNWYKQILL